MCMKLTIKEANYLGYWGDWNSKHCSVTLIIAHLYYSHQSNPRSRRGGGNYQRNHGNSWQFVNWSLTISYVRCETININKFPPIFDHNYIYVCSNIVVNLFMFMPRTVLNSQVGDNFITISLEPTPSNSQNLDEGNIEEVDENQWSHFKNKIRNQSVNTRHIFQKGNKQIICLNP